MSVRVFFKDSGRIDTVELGTNVLEEQLVQLATHYNTIIGVFRKVEGGFEFDMEKAESIENGDMILSNEFPNDDDFE